MEGQVFRNRSSHKVQKLGTGEMVMSGPQMLVEELHSL